MSTMLKFQPLPDCRIHESFLVLQTVGARIKESGRRQRISHITFETYLRWQQERANFIVTDDSDIAGLVTIRNEELKDWPKYIGLGRVQMVRGLATNPDFRGQRVGQFALTELIKQFGKQPIFLDCVTGFLPSYYAKFGFKVLCEATVSRPTRTGCLQYEICLMKYHA